MSLCSRSKRGNSLLMNKLCNLCKFFIAFVKVLNHCPKNFKTSFILIHQFIQFKVRTDGLNLAPFPNIAICLILTFAKKAYFLMKESVKDSRQVKQEKPRKSPKEPPTEPINVVVPKLKTSVLTSSKSVE